VNLISNETKELQVLQAVSATLGHFYKESMRLADGGDCLATANFNYLVRDYRNGRRGREPEGSKITSVGRSCAAALPALSR